MNRDVSYARALLSVSFPIASRWTNTRSPRDCQSPPSRVHFRKFIARQTRPRSCFVQKKITRMRADTWSDPPSKRASSRFNVSFLRLDAKISNFVRWGVSFFLGNFTRFTQGNNLYVKEDVVQKYFYRSREVIASLKSGSWRILEMDEFLHARVFILYLRGKKEEFEVDRNVLFLEIYRTSNLRRR